MKTKKRRRREKGKRRKREKGKKGNSQTNPPKVSASPPRKTKQTRSGNVRSVEDARSARSVCCVGLWRTRRSWVRTTRTRTT